MNSGDIFNRGEIVHTLTIPDHLLGPLQVPAKKRWGREELGNYASQFFGSNVRPDVTYPYGSNDRLTGTKVSIRDERKGNVITYALVEPKKFGNTEVHIIKVVDALDQGSDVDVIEYKFAQIKQQRKGKKDFNSPFAKLANLKL